jgi:hypothetical protein
MTTFATLGSCLSGMTGVMLAGDYRWTRLNNVSVDRSDLFVSYFLRQAPMPTREFLSTLFPVKPEHAHEIGSVFDRLYRHTAGLVEMPAGTTPFFDNVAQGRPDVLLLDNQFDTTNIKGHYHSFDGRRDFDFNFPVHWCERAAWMDEGLSWSPPLSAGESAAHWATIVRDLHTALPVAHIVFLCASPNLFGDNPERCARAEAFEPALRAALGDTDIEIVQPLRVPRALTKLPDDTEHFDLAVYRALAGRVFTHVHATPRAEPQHAG